MPSPFPGMNPYLENPSIWQGFHLLYLADIHRSLVRQLGGDYIVGVEETLFIHEASAEERRLPVRPDVAVTENRGHSPSSASRSAVAAVPPPVYATLPYAVTLEKYRWLEIRTADGGRVVTAIELLSPSNKGRHREEYEQKRRRVIDSDVNLVEIDLLRGGGRMPMDGLPPCDYCVMVARPDERPRVGAWPMGLRDGLPTIPVPLRPPDADAALDLQALLHDVYDAAGYASHVYRHVPQPPLPEEERAWAEGVVPR